MAPDGSLQEGCELRHVLDTGLCSAEQFFAAELKPDAYAANQAAIEAEFPADARPTIYHEDLRAVLVRALNQGWLQPEIVNLDTESEPVRAATLLGDVLSTLNHAPGPTMVVWNVIMKNPYDSKRVFTAKDLGRITGGHLFLQLMLRQGGWELAVDKLFSYDGSGKNSRTVMGTLVFVRRASAAHRRAG
jgi:hypothetical protein